MMEWLEVVLPVGTFVLGAVVSTVLHQGAEARALRRQDAANKHLTARLAASRRELEAARPIVVAPVAAPAAAVAQADFSFDRATLAGLQEYLLELHQAVLARLGTSGAETRTASVLDDMRLLNQVRMLAARTSEEEARRTTTRYAQQAEATLTAPGHDGGATPAAFQRFYLKATTALGEALTRVDAQVRVEAGE